MHHPHHRQLMDHPDPRQLMDHPHHRQLMDHPHHRQLMDHLPPPGNSWTTPTTGNSWTTPTTGNFVIGPPASAINLSLQQAATLDIRRTQSMAISDDFDTDLPDIQSPLRRHRCSADKHNVRQQTQSVLVSSDASHVSCVPATHSAPASSSQTPAAITHNSSVPMSRTPTVIFHNAPASTACTYDTYSRNAPIPCKSAAKSHNAQTPLSSTLAGITNNAPHTMTNITHKTSVSSVAIPASLVICAKTAADGFNSGAANQACGQRPVDCEKSASSLSASESMPAIDATAAHTDQRPHDATTASSVAMKSAEICVTVPFFDAARPKSREENLQEMTQEVASIFQISSFCKGTLQ